MKFTIPFKMTAFLVAAMNQANKPEIGTFVWGYRNNSPVVFIGIFKARHQTQDRVFYTIELLDGGSIDVNGLVTIPGHCLPYVVARDNKVYRIQRVIGDTLKTTGNHEFRFDEVQPVLYHESGLAKAASEPDLPNRVREEGV